MQGFDLLREFTSGKRYHTIRTTTMTESNSSESCPAMSSHDINENEGLKILTLTQE